MLKTDFFFLRNWFFKSTRPNLSSARAFLKAHKFYSLSKMPPKSKTMASPPNWKPAATAISAALNEWGISDAELCSVYEDWTPGQLSTLPTLAIKGRKEPKYHPRTWIEIGGKENITFLNVIRNNPEALKQFLVDLKADLEEKLHVMLPKQPPPPPPSLADQGFTVPKQQPTFTSSPMEGGGGCLLPQQQQPSFTEQQLLFYQQQQLLLQQLLSPQPSLSPSDLPLVLSLYFGNP
jgi:hypothetical protein